MPSIGDARRVDGAWEGWANEWVPLDRFPMPYWAVQIGVDEIAKQVIFQDENGNWVDKAGRPIEQRERTSDGTVRVLDDGSAEVFLGGEWVASENIPKSAGTFVPKEEGETPEERAERERNLVEAAREIIRSETGREPTGSEDQQLQRILLAGEDVLREARRLAALGVASRGDTTEDVEATEAPEPYFETERRLVEARRATEVAQKSRSAEEQFDAALDAGDLDKARLIRNFLDEPSEWQIELLKMEYADNLPALKILFDYVDAIGRADVVPEEARALVEQPADADARLRMLDFAAWQKTQPPQEPTQGPPGFGGISPDWMGAAEATAEEQKRSVFGGVGDIPPVETAGQAWRRLDPDLARHVAFMTGEPEMRHRETPIPSVPVLTSEMMASPIFQQALQTTKGTANEPIVKLLVDGIEWPLPASQYADFVKQRISWGETVEMPNREKGIWETLYVGDDGSIQVRPTVRPFKKGEFGERYFDDESVRFGRTGEQFVVPQRFTAEQIVEGSQFIPGGEQLGEEPPVFQQYPGSGVPPLAPFSLSQAEAGRPEGLPFTVTQETMDKIKSQQRIGLDPGEAHFVDPVTGQSGVMDFKTEADIEEFKKQRPGWVEVARTDPIPVAEPVFGPSRAEREATFIKEAQAFAPPPTFKKTPRPFGTPRFVTT